MGNCELLETTINRVRIYYSDLNMMVKNTI